MTGKIISKKPALAPAPKILVRGFTLVELLIVILIIGILAAVIAPRIIAMDRKAKEAATKRNLAALRAAIRFYVAENGVFPFTGYNGCSGSQEIPLPYNKSEHFNNDLVPKYLPKIPPVYLGRNERDLSGPDANDGRLHEGDNDLLIIGPTSEWYDGGAGRNTGDQFPCEWIYYYANGDIWVNDSIDELNSHPEHPYLRDSTGEKWHHN